MDNPHSGMFGGVCRHRHPSPTFVVGGCGDGDEFSSPGAYPPFDSVRSVSLLWPHSFMCVDCRVREGKSARSGIVELVLGVEGKEA